MHSRAPCAPSPVRRLTRGLEPARVAVQARYGPLLQHARAEWGAQRVSLALDTSRRWHTDGLGRLSIVSRGRAMPLVWSLVEHPRSRGASDVYQARWAQVAAWRPSGGTAVLTAERGVADTQLMAHLARVGGHWRSRSNGRLWV